MTGALPIAHPHLVRWVADCGAGLVAPTLTAVGAASPGQVRAGLFAAAEHAGLAGADAPTIRGYADALALAWSAPEPAQYVRSLSDAVGRFAADVTLVVRRVAGAADTIEEAQRVLAAAIERANGAVDWTFSYVAWGSPEADARTAAARLLAATASNSHQQMIAAISSIAGLLPADPAVGLAALAHPTAAQPAPRPGPWGDFRPPELTGAATLIDRRARDRLFADIRCGSPWRRMFAANTLDALRAAESSGGDGHAQLLVYDPDAFHGQGRSAISVGDVSSADHVAVLTPGIATSPSRLAATVPTAAGLRDAAAQADPGTSTAVVLWFGYDIPVSGSPNDTAAARELTDLFAAVSSEAAEQGAALLVSDTAVIRSTMRDSATMTLIGHSMGSVVTALAAREPIGADALVLLGSPGVGRDDATVADLHGVAAQNTYVLSSDRDPVTRGFTDFGATLAGGILYGPDHAAKPAYGTDPASARFGAQRIDEPAATVWDPGGGWRYPISEHALTRYLGGAGLLAVGAVVAGRSARVARARGR